MKKLINIGIADDHQFVREGLISLLKEFEGITVLFDVGNGREVLEKLKTKKPDIILLDIEMPIMNGNEVFEKIKLKYPGIKVIILSMHYKDSYIIEFIKNGVSGFLNKNSGIEKIIEAIRSVSEHGYYYDSNIALIMAKTIAHSVESSPGINRPDLNFTGREIQIIRLICLNKTNNDIAKSLFISVRTVEGHRLHIRQKTGCKNPMELTTFAIQNNLISM